MAKAPLQPREQQRLEALERAVILDTEPEDFFEDVADLVQAALGAPIVLISLVDETRQWFKAKRGLSLAQSPRDQGLCAHAIMSDAPLVIDDAGNDPRFAANPLVIGPPHLRAYAGAPIVMADATRLGTVCAIDLKARLWKPGEIDVLTRHARLVARHLEARRAQVEQARQQFLEQALARLEARQRTLLSCMDEGMVVHGPSGAIVDFNDAACEILGLSGEELYGRVSRDPRWRALKADGSPFPGDEHPAMVTLRTGAPQYEVVMSIETPDGERRWITINTKLIQTGDDKAPNHVMVVFAALPKKGEANAV